MYSSLFAFLIISSHWLSSAVMLISIIPSLLKSLVTYSSSDTTVETSVELEYFIKPMVKISATATNTAIILSIYLLLITFYTPP